MTDDTPRFFRLDASYRDELRKPFPKGQVGKLPKPYKKESAKGNCAECGGYHGLPAMHLDFVGHAVVTERLNTVAPDWSYVVDTIAEQNGHVTGILGTMTIGGKSIQEAGGVDRASTWGEELKLAISDFIRRGAMRFGVALDFWSKEELPGGNREGTATAEGPTGSAVSSPNVGAGGGSSAPTTSGDEPDVEAPSGDGTGAEGGQARLVDTPPSAASTRKPHEYVGDGVEPCKARSCGWAKEHPVHGKAAA